MSGVIEWLLESDHAIRWQVMESLLDAGRDVVAAERSLVEVDGWGARLLDLQGEDGQWARGAHFPGDFDWGSIERGEDGRLASQPWTATSWSLSLLRLFGLDPDSPRARRAIAGVREGCRWDHAGERFFDGETEPCINGLVVAVGSYFGEDVAGVVERLLGEQMDDGGWNCEQESGSTRGSFHTTISVLEGLLEWEGRFGQTPQTLAARAAGEEFMLERKLFRRLATGGVIDERWTRFSFPTWWRYDVLRGLEYLMRTGAALDSRAEEAVALVEANRTGDGRWPRQNVHRGATHFDIDAPEGEASRWNTLRAMRVLAWAGRSGK